jgi:hypothetical protein
VTTPRFTQILRAVEAETGVTLSDIQPRFSKMPHETRMKRLLVYMLREHTDLGYKVIANLTTGRGHSTWKDAYAAALLALDERSCFFDPAFVESVRRLEGVLSVFRHETADCPCGVLAGSKVCGHGQTPPDAADGRETALDGKP